MKKRERKQENYIYRNFKKSLSQLSLIKVYFWFSFFLFFLIAFLGFLFPIFFEEQILKIIENLIKQTKNLGVFGLIRFVISNNIQSAFFSFLLGIFLGIFPILILIVNSYILGFVANKIVASEGTLVLWRLLPHGIFEIPAILISVALGIRLGMFFFQAKDKQKSFLYLIVSALIFFGFSFIFLLIILLANFTLIQNSGNLSQQITGIVNSGFVSIFFLIIFIISYYSGTFILSKEDKKELINITKTSFRIFIFIVVPLLVIAGIIEGTLIWLLG